MSRAAILILSFVRVLLVEGAKTSIPTVENKTETDSNSPRRVLFGTEVQGTEFPFLVALHMPHSLCGGSIIADHWILTAAHCIRDVPCNQIKIMPAAWQNSETVYPVECYFHEQHIVRNYEYDIGLLGVAPNILQDGRARVVKLPAPGVHYPSGTPIVTAGWGKNEKDHWPYALLQANLRLGNWEMCNIRFLNHHPPGTREIPIRSVCLESDGPVPQGTCFGDSGGPAVTPDGVVIGVASFLLTEQDFCKYGGPSFFTSVVEYLPWILRHIDPTINTSNFPIAPEHILV